MHKLSPPDRNNNCVRANQDELSRVSNLWNKEHDENNYHDNEIINIIETDNHQIYYQTDKYWHYPNEERRYIPMNDNSAWYRIVGTPSKVEPKDVTNTIAYSC